MSRGLPPVPKAKGPVMDGEKPHLENLAEHLLLYSYVAGESNFFFFCVSSRLNVAFDHPCPLSHYLDQGDGVL